MEPMTCTLLTASIEPMTCTLVTASMEPMTCTLLTASMEPMTCTLLTASMEPVTCTLLTASMEPVTCTLLTAGMDHRKEFYTSVVPSSSHVQQFDVALCLVPMSFLHLHYLPQTRPVMVSNQKSNIQ